MKRLQSIIIALAFVLLMLPLGGCRSSKHAAGEQESATAQWANVTLPVKVTITKPAKLTFNGNAVLVRGKYVFISLRMLGFEVGQLYLSPSTADVVFKQPSKLWIEEPVAAHLAKTKMTFTEIQDAILGRIDISNLLPPILDITYGGTESKPEVAVSGTIKGKRVEATLQWNFGSAKWNVDSPKTFSTPGSSYRKTTAEAALKALSKL